MADLLEGTLPLNRSERPFARYSLYTRCSYLTRLPVAGPRERADTHSARAWR